MDRRNNYVGRGIGERIRIQGGTLDDIKFAVEDALRTGELSTDPHNAPLYQEDPSEAGPCTDFSYPDLPGRTEGIERSRRAFDAARLAVNVGSPVILDLNGDGVGTVAPSDGALFDHEGDGFGEATGWADPQDGLLVWDRNGDGVINDGRELFGNNTLLRDGTPAQNGFQALADRDDNSDGRIDSSDALWANLRVWRDLDGDGLSSGELMSLGDLDITSVNTAYTTSSYVDPQGNAHRQIGSFIRGGLTRTATDVWFRADKVFAMPMDRVDVPADIASLPDIVGYGTVHDLHQAMARDGSGTLRDLVQAFIAQTDAAQRRSILDQILLKWTGSDVINPTSRGPNIDARRLSTLEKFQGEPFVGTSGPNPTADAAILLEQSYQALAEMDYARLMTRSHLQGLYRLIAYSWNPATMEVSTDLSAVITELRNRLVADPMAGRILLGEFSRTVRGLGAEDVLGYWAFRETFAAQDPEFRWVIDSAGKNIIMGTSGDDPWLSGVGGIHDAIRGLAGNDYLNGCGGDDALYGDAGDDRLWGNTGNDLLVGGDGNDYLDGDLDDDRLEGGAGTIPCLV